MLLSTPHTFVGSTILTVGSLQCRRCEDAVAELIHAVPGVVAISVDAFTGMVTVTVSEPVDRADIAAALDRAGYPRCAPTQPPRTRPPTRTDPPFARTT